MSKTKSFLGGAAIAIQLGAADAATIPPGSSGLITDIKTTSSLGDIDPRLAGKPVLGQQRFIPSAGDRPEETTQVYQVRDNFALACQAAGGPVSSKAYTAGVYDQVIAAGSLNVLTDGTVNTADEVDMTSLKRNGPYMAALEGDINLVRANAGYGINKVTLFVDGKIMDATSLVEPSNYTIKVEETALYQQVRDAYLSGKEITVVALSDLGHTMVDTYRINPDVQKTFEECVSAENKSVPYNPYFSIDVEPLDTVPDGLVENLIGQQCLRGKVRPEDVTAVYTGDTARNYWRRWVHHELQSKTPVHNELRPGTITRASTIRDFAHAWCALHSWCGGSICTQI